MSLLEALNATLQIDDILDSIIYEIDAYSREKDSYDYGVPCSVDDMPIIRTRVRNVLLDALAKMEEQ